MRQSNKIDSRVQTTAAPGAKALPSRTVSALNVLRMSTDEAAELIDRTLEENFFLTRARQSPAQSSHDDPDAAQLVADTPSFMEYVLAQVSSLNLKRSELVLAGIFCEHLDDKGLLPSFACMDLPGASRAVLQKLQDLNPAGVFGCGIVDSFRIQLLRRGSVTSQMNLVLSNLHELETGGLDRLAVRAGINLDTVQACLHEIQTLSPWPTYGWYKVDAQDYIAPEVAITYDQNAISSHSLINFHKSLSYNSSFEDELRQSDISRMSEQLVDLREKARALMSAIELRHDTILKIALRVGVHNRLFFQTETDQTAKNTMSDIGKEIGLHESTISRAVRGVYARTPRGVFELRSFFSASTRSSNTSVSDAATAVQTRILELVRDEIVPLSDSEICSELASLGTTISRRTVAKYRSDLGVPPVGERLAGQTGCAL